MMDGDNDSNDNSMFLTNDHDWCSSRMITPDTSTARSVTTTMEDADVDGSNSNRRISIEGMVTLPTYGNDDIVNQCNDDINNQPVPKGGVQVPFPWKLHQMLDAVEAEGLDHIVSWRSHHRAFTVYKRREFVEDIMPRFFGQSKFASFIRQLNLYGFSRFAHGRDRNAYYHNCFIRGKPHLVKNMVRQKVKRGKSDTTHSRKPKKPSEEPNFYAPRWQQHQDSTNVLREQLQQWPQESCINRSSSFMISPCQISDQRWETQSTVPPIVAEHAVSDWHRSQQQGRYQRHSLSKLLREEGGVVGEDEIPEFGSFLNASIGSIGSIASVSPPPQKPTQQQPSLSLVSQDDDGVIEENEMTEIDACLNESLGSIASLVSATPQKEQQHELHNHEQQQYQRESIVTVFDTRVPTRQQQFMSSWDATDKSSHQNNTYSAVVDHVDQLTYDSSHQPGLLLPDHKEAETEVASDDRSWAERVEDINTADGDEQGHLGTNTSNNGDLVQFEASTFFHFVNDSVYGQ